MKKIICTILAAMLAISTMLVFVLCDSKDPTEQNPAPQEKTIVDMGGDEITLPAEINRVVSTSDPCSDMMLALGLADKLYGVYFRSLENPWFSVFYPNADSLESYNAYQPEVESLYAADVDLVFVPNVEFATALRDKGICAVTIRFYTPSEIEYAVTMLGEIFGGTAVEKGTAWLTDFHNAITQVGAKLAGVAESDKPVAYEILADKARGPFRTYYGDNQAWLSYAGGILATAEFADATSQVMPTEEAILAKNPDVIFVGGTCATKEYANLLVDEKWANIEAVKQNQIYVEPTGATAWNNCSTSYPLLIYFCLEKMYPELVDFNLKEMTRDFYLKYYGIDFTDEQLNLMLQAKAPDGSELWKE